MIGMLGGLACLVPGCGRGGEAPLVIASAWPEAVREELVASYRRGSGPTRPIEWVDLAPGDRPADALGRRGGVDLVLGGSPLAFAGMDEAGLLVAPWRIIRGPEPAAPPEPAASRPPVEFADPRDDLATLALVSARLREGDWAARYAALVRRAAGGRPAIGAVADGRSALGDPGPESGRGRREGVAATKGGRNREEAGRFVAFVAEDRPPGPGAEGPPAAEGLLADLLGATLVDAHDELRAASVALHRHGLPSRAEGAFVEAPPWPPASVARLQAEPSDLALLEILAEQIAPDPDVRSWLLESWSRPTRPIDGALLDELGRAVGGRLAGEPRFRAWLRAEWTAWARQRYRRVARVAGGWVPL